METTHERALRRTDYLWLLGVCAVMFGIAVVDNRTLTTHEAAHSQNVYEMFTSGNYLIPTYGGRPWLERPPIPHWLTGIVALAVGDPGQPWALRLGSVLMGTLTVLVWGWAVAGALGRSLGFISAVALATVREMPAYATGPEADIFIASFVTLAGAFVLRAEFGPKADRSSRATFFGKRPWTVWGFFVVLGTTNAMKGPLFGTAFLGLALSVYLLWSRDWGALRRYVWCWGWLAYLAVGLAWPVFAYLHHPEVAEVWQHDYGKRWNTNYIGEPFYYYAVQVPWNLFPWTIPFVVGIVTTFRTVVTERQRAWQFVWCWALVPPLVFSLFNGKHHHYMLNCIAPQAVLCAVGAVALWRTMERLPWWLRTPWLGGTLLGVGGAIAVLAFKHKIPGPTWLPTVVAVGLPVCILATWWCISQRRGVVALAGFVGVIMIVNTAAYLHRTRYLDNYQHDLALLRAIRSELPPNTTIYVLNEDHPLNGAWLLYYLGPPTKFLQNSTFLVSDQITASEIYVLGRQRDATQLRILGDPPLAQYGTPTLVMVSAKTRAEVSPDFRYALFKLHFRADLERHPEPYVSGMQATGRADGPTLPVK